MIVFQKEGQESIEHRVVSPVDNGSRADIFSYHLFSICKSFFCLLKSIGNKRLFIRHTVIPSSAIFLTMGEDLKGEFSISPLVKIRGEITT